GDLVLTYDNERSIDMSSSKKLTYRWKGPYRVREVKNKNEYFIETLDGIAIDRSYAP
ncbi:hypothetical protein QBC32DRAFT_195058, partial [Pseudoneurospora amorphoporcata]